jgi:hypothetical protein
MAAAGKSQEIVEFLRTFMNDNNIEIAPADQAKALHSANESPGITKILIDEVKTDKQLEYVPDSGSSTALMLACEKGCSEVVKIILKKKLEFMDQDMQDGSVLDSSLWMMTNKVGFLLPTSVRQLMVCCLRIYRKETPHCRCLQATIEITKALKFELLIVMLSKWWMN